jgi:DNA-binding NtrC family response regulator
MGLVLWIDGNTFATGLLEKVFKSKHLPFYTLSDVKDFLYLIDDLRPELLVLDALTVKNEEEKFIKQFELSESLRSLPVVVIGDEDDLPYVRNKVGFLKRPFDPFKVPDVLHGLIRSH